MRRTFYISLILLVYLLLCGKSCNEDDSRLLDQQKEMEAEKELIRRAFEVAYLTEESRYASEVAAIQKLGDLSGLLDVYADPSLDTTFRVKAGEMIRKIFVPGDVTLTFDLLDPGGDGKMALDDLLREKALDKVIPSKVSFDSIRVIDPLQRSRPQSYHGTLGCRQETILFLPGDTLSRSGDILVEIHVARAVKVFGTDTVQVWEVLLGDLSSGVRIH